MAEEKQYSGKKIFKFRGKTIEELNAMNLNEFSLLLDSRGRRSLKRGLNKPFMKQLEKAVKGEKNKPIRTHRRDIIIIPKMVGLRIDVYNGKEFVPVNITEKMLGHYLGELVLTRKRLIHGKAGIGATRSSTAITAR